MSSMRGAARVPLVAGAALLLLVGVVAGLLVGLRLGDGNTATGPATPSDPSPTTAADPSGPPAPPAEGPVVAVAGDIGVSGQEDSDTAALVQRIAPDLVLTTGDNAYGDGTAENYAENYDPDWGRFKAITRPSPGNHDYHDEAGDPPYYFTYFAEQLPDENDGQYYAFDLGSWRLYSLNCEIDCSDDSAQVGWLRDDLATNATGKNVLAYLHRPRFSCGRHGSSSQPEALWDTLIAAHADVMLAGHDHNYQRFPRMTSSGDPSPDGLASFVVGTGGNGLYDLEGGETGCDHLSFGQDSAFGVLQLALGEDSYSWEFVATDGSVMDSGTAPTLGGGAAVS